MEKSNRMMVSSLQQFKKEMMEWKALEAKRALWAVLEWGMDHADYGSFVYGVADNNSKTKYESKYLVPKILFAFRQGRGWNISTYHTLDWDISCYGVRCGSQGAWKAFECFRELLLVNQIFALTGLKPKLKLGEQDPVYPPSCSIFLAN